MRPVLKCLLTFDINFNNADLPHVTVYSYCRNMSCHGTSLKRCLSLNETPDIAVRSMQVPLLILLQVCVTSQFGLMHGCERIRGRLFCARKPVSRPKLTKYIAHSNIYKNFVLDLCALTDQDQSTMVTPARYDGHLSNECDID